MRRDENIVGPVAITVAMVVSIAFGILAIVATWYLFLAAAWVLREVAA
jgi:hypothetical protein